MEDLNETLYRLLWDELNDLKLGHPFNMDRLKTMLNICEILTYLEYVELSDDDIIKLIRFYDY